MDSHLPQYFVNIHISLLLIGLIKLMAKLGREDFQAEIRTLGEELRGRKRHEWDKRRSGVPGGTLRGQSPL